MAQINPTVGDFSGNRKVILEYIQKAKAQSCDIVIFPELCVTGYPPEDLLFKGQFVSENRASIESISKTVCGITAIIGFVDGQGRFLYNSATVISDKKIVCTYHKILLPNYGVFDEQRYFQPGNDCIMVNILGVQIGINICEDIWYDNGPATTQALNGADLIINISSSPFYSGRLIEREKMLIKRATELQVAVAYINQVGGQDELVFDGGSMVINPEGLCVFRAPQFEEGLFVVDVNINDIVNKPKKKTVINSGPPDDMVASWQCSKYTVTSSTNHINRVPVSVSITPTLSSIDEVYRALVLGTRDYVRKNHFKHAVIGLSGGIDSSLVAVVATEALGKDNVTCVAMPSQYSSDESYDDAKQLCANLGAKLLTISIENIYDSYLTTMQTVFCGLPHDTTEENIQARIRGNILMALSNKFGWLVLTTGNKSEMATGYTTLYGDMAGGFAVIKDLPKTMVYEMSLHINKVHKQHPIPDTVLSKAPTAELRHNQKDIDSLPSYEILDPIINAYVEQDKSVGEIIAQGYNEEIVRTTARLVDSSEYKRRQAPPGIKLTPRAFGRDRRLPITNRFRDV